MEFCEDVTHTDNNKKECSCVCVCGFDCPVKCDLDGAICKRDGATCSHAATTRHEPCCYCVLPGSEGLPPQGRIYRTYPVHKQTHRSVMTVRSLPWTDSVSLSERTASDKPCTLLQKDSISTDRVREHFPSSSCCRGGERTWHTTTDGRACLLSSINFNLKQNNALDC